MWRKKRLKSRPDKNVKPKREEGVKHRKELKFESKGARKVSHN
jgi:hypothetical protein